MVEVVIWLALATMFEREHTVLYTPLSLTHHKLRN
jgi:hypothetical protein